MCTCCICCPMSVQASTNTNPKKACPCTCTTSFIISFSIHLDSFCVHCNVIFLLRRHQVTKPWSNTSFWRQRLQPQLLAHMPFIGSCSPSRSTTSSHSHLHPVMASSAPSWLCKTKAFAAHIGIFKISLLDPLRRQRWLASMRMIGHGAEVLFQHNVGGPVKTAWELVHFPCKEISSSSRSSPLPLPQQRGSPGPKRVENSIVPHSAHTQ